MREGDERGPACACRQASIAPPLWSSQLRIVFYSFDSMSVTVVDEDASSLEDPSEPSAAQNDSRQRRSCSRLLQLIFHEFLTLGKASRPEELPGVHAPVVDSVGSQLYSCSCTRGS